MSLDIKLPWEEKKKQRGYVSKKEVKKFFGYRCQICSKSEKEVGKLEMAHYKAHSRGGGLVFPLCPTCHTKYDEGLLTSRELKKLNLNREEYQKYRPKKKKVKKQDDILSLRNIRL